MVQPLPAPALPPSVPGGPIIIRIAEPKSELQGLSDVLLGSLGLAGMFILGAVVLAALFAGLLYVWRSKVSGGPSADDDLHIA